MRDRGIELLGALNDVQLENLVKRALNHCMPSRFGKCVFDDAVSQACAAFDRYADMPLDTRRAVIEGIKEDISPHIGELARMSAEETNMGNAGDKAKKIELALRGTPGVEDLVSEVLTDDRGLTLFELSPWGVACTVLPRTNPCATLINNTISLLAAGNAVIHIPHSRASRVTAFLAGIIDAAVMRRCGIKNLVTAVGESSMAAAYELMTHPDVQMIVSTGGIDVLRRAMSAGKKVIGAGPANPVVIADETADINKAAKDIIEGASFDNNVMCVTEKSVVAVDSIADTLERAMERNGALILNRLQDVIALRNAAVTEDRLPSKMLEGRSASEILDAAGLPRTGSPKVILAETEPDDPLVTLELPMPVLPLVRARNFDEALELALEIEQGFRHTAILHSKSIERLSRAAKALQTALFVKNGSSLAGIGMNGGPASFTIATATGEGTTTARHFTRRRRCVLSESFSIR